MARSTASLTIRPSRVVPDTPSGCSHYLRQHHHRQRPNRQAHLKNHIPQCQRVRATRTRMAALTGSPAAL